MSETRDKLIEIKNQLQNIVNQIEADFMEDNVEKYGVESGSVNSCLDDLCSAYNALDEAVNYIK